MKIKILEEGEAAPDAARHEVPASDNERSAPDVSQEVTFEQGLMGPNITTRSEEQRVRDPAVQEQDIVRDTEMSDPHNLQDEERTQAGRESSKITTSSATARITIYRPRKRATVPGVQGGQMSPIFKPPPQGPVNMARRTRLWWGQRHRNAACLKTQMRREWQPGRREDWPRYHLRQTRWRTLSTSGSAIWSLHCSAIINFCHRGCV